MRNLQAVGIVAASVLVVAVAQRGCVQHRSDDEQRSARSPQHARADAEPRLSRRPLQVTPPARAAPTDGDAPDTASDPVPGADQPARRDSPEPVEDISPDEIRASVEDRFQADKVDRGSTADARRQATEHLARGLVAGSVLGEVECRASICRAEIEQTDVAAHRAFLQSSIAPGWQGPAMATLKPRDGHGRVVTVVYLGRTANALADAVPVESLDMPPVEPPRGGERVPPAP